jgi:serine/threonine protein kinase HipA of HipAB toxin-antitoxin module
MAGTQAGRARSGETYARLAEQAIASGVPGSSAAGEFPKFPALRELAGSATPHVLVKFSGADDSPAVRRWADLLICEHLALECAAGLPGGASARSRIVQSEGRTFLEVERFDRHGEFGRSRLASLATLDAALLGDGSTDWTRVAARFAAAGLLSADDVRRIERLWWFGRLIANSDMHAGNLSFRPLGLLELAPTYDMLPMLYAPLPGGEVPSRGFEPPLPLPEQRVAWTAACAVAIEFWSRAARDARLSESFRKLCSANAQQLQRVVEKI